MTYRICILDDRHKRFIAIENLDENTIRYFEDRMNRGDKSSYDYERAIDSLEFRIRKNKIGLDEIAIDGDLLRSMPVVDRLEKMLLRIGHSLTDSSLGSLFEKSREFAETRKRKP